MASEPVPVEQVDRDAANIAFDDVLGDAGSYAEYMRPSYREGGVRTLTKDFTRHRLAALEAVRMEANGGSFKEYVRRLTRQNVVTVEGDIVRLTSEVMGR